MSGGYTPLFETMLEGTLYAAAGPIPGSGPAFSRWSIQAGENNKNPQLIANAIGAPIAQFDGMFARFHGPRSGQSTLRKKRAGD